MAKRVVLIDDLDGQSEASETVRFGIDGAWYDIDLSDLHAKELRTVLAKYVAGGLPVRDIPSKPTPASKTSAKVDRDQYRAIRAWWNTNWKAANLSEPLTNKGRIPGVVSDAFQKHQGMPVPVPVPPAESNGAATTAASKAAVRGTPRPRVTGVARSAPAATFTAPVKAVAKKAPARKAASKAVRE